MYIPHMQNVWNKTQLTKQKVNKEENEFGSNTVLQLS